MHLAAAQAAPHPPGPTARIARPGAGTGRRVTSVICVARLGTDLLDKRPFALLLEPSKRLICQTLVSGQPLRYRSCPLNSNEPWALHRTKVPCIASNTSRSAWSVIVVIVLFLSQASTTLLGPT